MKAIIVATLLAVVGASALSVKDFQCAGVTNPFPINSTAPTFVKQVPNGKLYRAGSGSDYYNVVHLWGTPYQRGVAQGQLLSDDVKAITAMIIPYIEQLVKANVPGIPSWIVDLLIQYGAPVLLQLSWSWTLPFTPSEYTDEIQGIADGSGVAVTLVQNLNQFPELTKAACTIVGATGPSTTNGLLAQLRGLDFDPTCPMKNYAQITVYHNNDPAKATFLTVGWTAMIGALTGFSDKGVGIGEKVWLPDNADQIDGVNGKPWMFILRDVLEYTSTLQGGLTAIKDANRTCPIHVALGSAQDNAFRGLTIAQKAYEIYNDTSLNYTGHPSLPGIMYWNKHKQPSSSPCLGNLLQNYYGAIDAEKLVMNVAAIGETGDMHAVSFDYAGKIMFMANARKTFATDGDLPAYNRQFNKVDMAALFAETAPALH